MKDINKLFLSKQAQIFAPTINRPIMLSQENFALVSLFAKLFKPYIFYYLYRQAYLLCWTAGSTERFCWDWRTTVFDGNLPKHSF